MDAAPGPAPDRRIAHALGRRRKRVNAAVIALCMAATAIGLAFLASILFTLLHRGLGALGWGVFVNPTRPPGGGGGLANAIAGSLIQSLAGTLAGAPVGLLAGTWLAEYARDSFPGHVVRFVSDVLLSAPSILIGLFIYIVVVIPMGGFSGIAGSLALAVIVIPIVLRTTEDMLRLVPDTLREAVIGLGAPKWKMITLVSYRAVRQGIATGVLLAIARVAGETAPLLFTSLGNLNWSLDPGRPMASLPVTIYNYAGSAFAEWVDLAWTGALLITAGVLALNIAARVALRDRSTDTRR